MDDQTREIPFEELNSLQNPLLVHGQGYYIKGIAHHGPDYPSMLAAHTRLIARVNEKNLRFRARILFEYFPLSKVTSVPRGTTAFMRTGESNVLILVGWTPAAAAGTSEALDLGETEKGNTDEARELAKELAEILLSGQREEDLQLGYTNYSALQGD